MKKYAVWFVVMLLGISYIFVRLTKTTPKLHDSTTEYNAFPTAAPTHSPQTVNSDTGTIAYEIFEIDTTFHISLIPNFQAKDSASVVYANNSCELLTNAGFYTPEDTPIGRFFVINTQYNQPYSSNSLFTHVVAKHAENIPKIVSKDAVSQTSEWEFQTGPVLLFDRKPKTLSLITDEHARRLVYATNTIDQKGYLIVLFDQKDTVLGPLLADIPTILTRIAAQDHIELDTAINLDGGWHSTYISHTSSLQEYAPVGSYLCIRQ